MSLDEPTIYHPDHLHTSNIESSDAPHPLDVSRTNARATGLAYAGILTPPIAWKLVQEGKAVLVDVRTTEERKFVGHVPGTMHVPWATGTSLTRNPRFVKELESRVGSKELVICLLCRSGNRSAAAATAAHAAGFTDVFNVAGGFEGDLDDRGQRGHLGGWRHEALPWIQD